jgi:hypothetical protein
MFNKKTLLGLAAFSAAVTPLVSNFDFDLRMAVTSKERSYVVVETACDLTSKKFSGGFLVCDYKCRDGDKSHVNRTYYNNSSFCPATITERIKLTKRN